MIHGHVTRWLYYLITVKHCRMYNNSPSARTQQVLPLFKITQLTCTASAEELLVRKTGALPNGKHCQGQMHTPQSVTIHNPRSLHLTTCPVRLTVFFFFRKMWRWTRSNNAIILRIIYRRQNTLQRTSRMLCLSQSTRMRIKKKRKKK